MSLQSISVWRYTVSFGRPKSLVRNRALVGFTGSSGPWLEMHRSDVLVARKASVAVSWPSPLPHWPWLVTELAFEGFRKSRAVPVPERTDSCGPSWSSLPFRAVYLPPWPLIPPLARRELASSHEIHLDYRSDLALHLAMRSQGPDADNLPSIDSPPSVHSCACRHARRFRGAILELPFRPRGFAPPRRFPPLGGCGLVASRCRSWGSSRFLLSAVSLAHRRTGCSRRTTHFPRRCFVPFEEFPSPTAVPRHRGRCLPAVSNDLIAVLGKRPFPGSSSAHRQIEASAPRLCSVVESVTPAPPFPVALRPILPWALFPLQGPSVAGIPLPTNAATKHRLRRVFSDRHQLRSAPS